MQLELDECPNCGEHQKMGLRCHPKWSVKVGIEPPEGEADMVAYYAHDENSARHLYRVLKADSTCFVMSIERWNGEIWVEVFF